MARKPKSQPEFPARRRGRKCVVCHHADRALIEAAHVAGASLGEIADKYHIGRDSVFRHMRRHVPDDLRAMYVAEVPLREVAERAAKEGLSLIEYLALARSVLVQEFQLAAQTHDRNGTAILAGRLLETVKQMAALTGELARMNPALTINNTAVFIQSPAFAQLHSMLIERLRDYPAALAAVLAGLEELERQEAGQTIEHAPAAIPAPTEATYAA